MIREIPREDGRGKLVLNIEDDGETVSINSVGETRTVIIGLSRGEARAIAYQILGHTLPASKEMREAIGEAIRDQKLGRITGTEMKFRVEDLPSMDNGLVDYD